jgi:hypothetical protein
VPVAHAGAGQACLVGEDTAFLKLDDAEAQAQAGAEDDLRSTFAVDEILVPARLDESDALVVVGTLVRMPTVGRLVGSDWPRA